jgi:hypothetical protein
MADAVEMWVTDMLVSRISFVGWNWDDMFGLCGLVEDYGSASHAER